MVAFGTGSQQVARGNHTHAQLHDAVTVANSDTLALGVSVQQVSGSVRLNLSPGAAATALASDSSGLYVPSGTLALTGHGHSSATPSAAGFMSATDKVNLDALSGDGVLAAFLALTPAHYDLAQWNSGTGAWENHTPGDVKLTLGLVAADVGLENVPNVDATRRENHSGTQLASTIADFDAAVALAPAVVANTAKVTNATHTGDVTGATALTIANDAVTNAKLANVATATIKGRATAGTGDPEDLTPAQAWGVIDDAALDTAQNWTKAQGSTPVALSDGANIATDASLSNVFTVTLGGNRTLDNPTNLVAGRTYVWVITQDGTGGRTLAYGSNFDFPDNLLSMI